MMMTKAQPSSVAEILVEEFMAPLGLTQAVLAEAMGMPRKYVNELCNGRRNITVPTALILDRVFDTSADFWLNLQRRNDLWAAMRNPKEMERIARARPLGVAA